MNHLEKTYWDMQKSCIFFAQSNETIWGQNPIIKDDFDLLVSNEKELAIMVLAQTAIDTEGLVAQKKQDMQLLGKDIYKLGRSLSHLAKKTNNQVLLKTVDFSESRLHAGEERETLLRFSSLLTTGRANLTLLAPYLVTAEQIDEMEARLNKLSDLPDTITLKSGTRKSATRSIKELIAEARLILDRLDDAFEAMIADEKFLEN